MTDLLLRDGNLTLDVPNITEAAYQDLYETTIGALDTVAQCAFIASQRLPNAKVDRIVNVVRQITKDTIPPSGEVNERFLMCLQMLGRVVAIHALIHEEEERLSVRHDA